jgi:hypothetical protein
VNTRNRFSFILEIKHAILKMLFLNQIFMTYVYFIFTGESIQPSCIKTPAQGSYYCAEHRHLDKSLLHFKYLNSKRSFQLEEIKAIKGQLSCEKKRDIIIHDSFVREDNVVLFLVSNTENNPFWATENQLPNEIINQNVNHNVPYNI